MSPEAALCGVPFPIVPLLLLRAFEEAEDASEAFLEDAGLGEAGDELMDFEFGHVARMTGRPR